MEKETLLVEFHQLKVIERLQGLEIALTRSSLKTWAVLVTVLLKTLESNMVVLWVTMS